MTIIIGILIGLAIGTPFGYIIAAVLCAGEDNEW